MAAKIAPWVGVMLKVEVKLVFVLRGTDVLYCPYYRTLNMVMLKTKV